MKRVVVYPSDASSNRFNVSTPDGAVAAPPGTAATVSADGASCPKSMATRRRRNVMNVNFQPRFEHPGERLGHIARLKTVEVGGSARNESDRSVDLTA